MPFELDFSGLPLQTKLLMINLLQIEVQRLAEENIKTEIIQSTRQMIQSIDSSRLSGDDLFSNKLRQFCDQFNAFDFNKVQASTMISTLDFREIHDLLSPGKRFQSTDWLRINFFIDQMAKRNSCLLLEICDTGTTTETILTHRTRVLF